MSHKLKVKRHCVQQWSKTSVGTHLHDTLMPCDKLFGDNCQSVQTRLEATQLTRPLTCPVVCAGRGEGMMETRCSFYVSDQCLRVKEGDGHNMQELLTKLVCEGSNLFFLCSVEEGYFRLHV